MTNIFQELTGKQYLKAEIACKFDKTNEKKTWNDRLKAFDKLDIENLQPKDVDESSNPIGLKAALVAYQDTMNDKPTGYMVSLDAVSSGLQLLSILSGCPKSFSLCGGQGDKCVDSYTTIHAAMNTGVKLSRKEVKQAIMTSLYGSVSTPERVFKEDIDVFYTTMESEVPGAWDLNIGLQEIWDDIEGANYDWVLPDNFHCRIETSTQEFTEFGFLDQKYQVAREVNARPKFHKGTSPNLVHSVDGFINREIFRRCMFNEERNQKIIYALNSKEVHGATKMDVKLMWSHYLASGFLSVRILDYLTEDTMGLVDPMVIALMIQSLPEKSFDLVSIHDNFKCHPNYGNDIRRQYNRIIADINDSEMLQYLVSQMTDNPDLKVHKFGKIDRDEILNGNYLVC